MIDIFVFWLCIAMILVCGVWLGWSLARISARSDKRAKKMYDDEVKRRSTYIQESPDEH